MSIKSTLAIPFAKNAQKKVYKWAYEPHKTQQRIFKELIKKQKIQLLVKITIFIKLLHIQSLKNK